MTVPRFCVAGLPADRLSVRCVPYDETVALHEMVPTYPVSKIILSPGSTTAVGECVSGYLRDHRPLWLPLERSRGSFAINRKLRLCIGPALDEIFN